MTNNGNQQSILIVGATGVVGLQCLRQLSNHSSKPAVHVFCRNPSKLSKEDKALCASVTMGNVRDTKDIQEALTKTKADVCILTIGSGGKKIKTDIRTASGQALATAMEQPQFEHVRAVVLSSLGAGDSRMIVGFGIGTIIEYNLRHPLADHTTQEQAFEKVKSRTLILRPAGFTDNHPTGNTILFEANEKCPSTSIDRADLAGWITEEVTSGKLIGGEVVHITSGPKKQ